MDMVLVNYGLNQKYLVEKRVFEKIVEKIIRQTREVKLLSSQINIILGETVDIELRLLVYKDVILSPTISNIVTKIEEKIENLINTFPKNIKIIIERGDNEYR